jgi:hypothetical protein
MISIIICSRKKDICNDFKINIKSTIGCSYELIVIDNSENRYSIFEAYNLGIKKSNGNFLCFMHDDVLIHTQNWGVVIKRIFQSDSKIGLIGIAGSKIKTKMPSAWWDCEDSCKRMNLIQHFANGEIRNWQIGWNDERIEEVVVVDGVFMLARKVEEIEFNEKLKGFHNYDLNLSFEYIKNDFKVMVTKNVLIEHFSIGMIDESWYNSSLQIYEIYRNVLPLSVVESYDLKNEEIKNGIRFISRLLDFMILKEAFSFWLKLIFLKPLSKFHFYFVKQFVKKIFT